MRTVSYITNFSELAFRVVHWIIYRVPKHLHKSGFDKLVQFSKLLLAERNQTRYFIKDFCNFALLFIRWQVKWQRVKNGLGQMLHCCAMCIGCSVFQNQTYLMYEKIF